jgi:hydrogenase maturation protease
MDLVVGVGNTLRSDDGLGIRVAEALSAHGSAETVTVQQLTLDLTERLSRADRVLFVDADAAGCAVKLAPLHPSPGVAQFGHALSAEQLLRWTVVEHDVCPEAWMLSVPGQSFDLGEELSPEAMRALESARRVALGWLAGRSECEPNEEDE